MYVLHKHCYVNTLQLQLRYDGFSSHYDIIMKNYNLEKHHYKRIMRVEEKLQLLYDCTTIELRLNYDSIYYNRILMSQITISTVCIIYNSAIIIVLQYN